jgi:hypothetical protein
MLKPAEDPPTPEPSIGDLAERLLDDAVDYGRAEIALLKARALEIVATYVRATILFAVAAVLALAAVVTLFVAIAATLARWLGPLGGGIASTLLAAALAGLLVWLALRDLDKAR